MGLHVLIVGAGIAGLAMARSLRDRGIEADVVERDRAVRGEGAGIFLPGNAVSALAGLGFADAVRPFAHPITRMRIGDQRGRLLVDLPMDDVWGAGSQCLCVRRADLHRVLAEGTKVRYGVDLSDVDTDGYDLVVGADGVRSAVRRRTFPGVEPRAVGLVAWRYLADGFGEEGTWRAWQGADRAFLAVALGGGRAYCYAESDHSPAGDWRELFAGFAGPVRDLVAQGAGAHVGAVEEVSVETPVAGRTVLVGDAAHANPPNMAQGAAMAFEDAIVLADHLSRLPPDEALSSFATRRAPRVEWVRTQTRRRDKARHLPPPVRDTVIRLAGRRIIRGNFALLRAEP